MIYERKIRIQMNDAVTVCGWVNPYTSNIKVSAFTADKKCALLDIIENRQYWFTHFDLEYMDCCPLFSDGTISVPTKQELDDIFNMALSNTEFEQRNLPCDIAESIMVDDIRWETAELYERLNSEVKYE